MRERKSVACARIAQTATEVCIYQGNVYRGVVVCGMCIRYIKVICLILTWNALVMVSA